MLREEGWWREGDGEGKGDAKGKGDGEKGRQMEKRRRMVKGRAYLGPRRHSLMDLDPRHCLHVCVLVVSSLGCVALLSLHVSWSCRGWAVSPHCHRHMSGHVVAVPCPPHHVIVQCHHVIVQCHHHYLATSSLCHIVSPSSSSVWARWVGRNRGWGVLTMVS